MTSAEGPVRELTLCADDFGLHRGVSAGIAQLVHAGRLSAVSCITNSADWLAAVPQLGKRPVGVALGLHINLTEGRPLSPALARVWPRLPSLPRLILLAHAGLLPRSALRAEMRAQLELFRVGTGVMPRHVDGHQHVHHLPVIRMLVMELVGAIVPAPAVRSAARLPGADFALKRWLIQHTGAGALERQLVRRRLVHNRVLLGVYDFSDGDYGGRMRHWLSLLPASGGWLFCHPGLDSAQHDVHVDAIGGARQRELAYLASDRFLQDLDAARVRLVPGRDLQANVQRRLTPKVSSRDSAVASN